MVCPLGTTRRVADVPLPPSLTPSQTFRPANRHGLPTRVSFRAMSNLRRVFRHSQRDVMLAAVTGSSSRSMKRREFLKAAGTIGVAVGGASALWAHGEGVLSVG